MSERPDDRLDSLLGALREEHRASPELREAVMARVREIPEPWWRRAAAWLLRPRTVRLSPATAGLAFAAVIGILVAWPARGPEDVTAPGTGVAEAGGAVPTRFVFVAPGAASVRMTGDFVGWDPEGVRLSDPRGTGMWTVDLPLEPGVYQYAFIVESADGTQWRADPLAVSQVDDGFGQTNSVVIVSRDGEV